MTKELPEMEDRFTLGWLGGRSYGYCSNVGRAIHNTAKNCDCRPEQRKVHYVIDLPILRKLSAVFCDNCGGRIDALEFGGKKENAA